MRFLHDNQTVKFDPANATEIGHKKTPIVCFILQTNKHINIPHNGILRIGALSRQGVADRHLSRRETEAHATGSVPQTIFLMTLFTYTSAAWGQRDAT